MIQLFSENYLSNNSNSTLSFISLLSSTQMNDPNYLSSYILNTSLSDLENSSKQLLDFLIERLKSKNEIFYLKCYLSIQEILIKRIEDTFEKKNIENYMKYYNLKQFLIELLHLIIENICNLNLNENLNENNINKNNSNSMNYLIYERMGYILLILKQSYLIIRKDDLIINNNNISMNQTNLNDLIYKNTQNLQNLSENLQNMNENSQNLLQNSMKIQRFLHKITINDWILMKLLHLKEKSMNYLLINYAINEIINELFSI